jgi:ankyrin repeat protein
MIRKMIQKGEDPNKMDARGLRPLSVATGLGHDQVVHALLDSGAYVGLPNRDGSSPLVGAITFGNANLVTHLLNQGASPEIGNSVISPLGLASRLGKNDILRLLLNKGADPNAVYYHGTSPLFSATASNNTSGMIELLKKGANINHRNAQGRTALIIAVSTNQLEATSVLLDHGIEVNIQEAALLIRFTGTLKNPEKQKFIKVLKKFTLNLLNQGAGVPQENLKAAKLLASKLKNL